MPTSRTPKAEDLGKINVTQNIKPEKEMILQQQGPMLIRLGRNTVVDFNSIVSISETSTPEADLIEISFRGTDKVAVIRMSLDEFWNTVAGNKPPLEGTIV